MASGRTEYHVTYEQDGNQWRVVREGAERASSVHATKQEAVDAGRKLAKNNAPSQLIVHRAIHLMNGTIETEYAYGSDPERYPS